MIKVPKKVLSVNLEVSLLEFLEKDLARYQERIGTRVSLSAFVNKILDGYRLRTIAADVEAAKEEDTIEKPSKLVPDVEDEVRVEG